MSIFTKLFGSHSERELRRIEPIVNRIEALEEEYKKLSDGELRAKTDSFKERLQNGETLDDILPEAFATVREAGDRVIGQRAFRVQLIGGIVLHQGRIAEMKTGEGKTLAAVFPSYLNGLAGKGVHVVTVNDFLASTQSELMGKIHNFLGLSVGCIVHGITNDQRRDAYACDITYGTNNEFGFDYLRDNMAIYKRDMVQRGHSFAIVDEVDSILIDEARTPLIISGPGDKSTDLYEKADRFASLLTPNKVVELDEKSDQEDIKGDYVVDEKARTATLTASGVRKAEQYFKIENLTDPENATLMHHINQAIKAHGLMKRDVDYVVRDGEVIIVDEFTGRLMFGRRYNEGLHQAIEAKEKVKVERESKTLATITFQNYFRLYSKLSGMTGTALTEEEEFRAIYNLDVIEIPTNRPMIRIDHNDAIYKTEAGKFKQVIAQIEECHKKGQPVLVGTISIEKSEHLSNLLKNKGIKHVVLNAKYHDKEAELVAGAGRLGAVTIATNMAGRGTDIMLGGNPEHMAKNDLLREGFSEDVILLATGRNETDNEEILRARARYHELYAKRRAETDTEAKKVKEAGGLFIVGTERHESRRIDNQLRGRAGRQGDPGESRFYISIEDDLMRLFGSERIMNMMNALGIDEETPINHKMLTNALENAQKRVESRNFQMRKTVLEYDDVLNNQRKIIYEERRKVLDGEDLKSSIRSMTEEWIKNTVKEATHGEQYLGTGQAEMICARFEGVFLAHNEIKLKESDLNSIAADEFADMLVKKAFDAYERREAELTSPIMREVERVVLLRNVDTKWMDHIDAMHELRQGISLRAYGQQNPLVEYKREGYDMFESMIAAIREDTVRSVFTVRVRGEEAPKREKVVNTTFEGSGDGTAKKSSTVRRKEPKVGRNDPCPCGSGKKYKKCCGA